MIPFQYLIFLENDAAILATQWIDISLMDGTGILTKYHLN